MNVGLFFGSFNPIHIGHLIIGNYVAEEMPLDQVWYVVSPQSPFKKKNRLLNEYDRLRMVELAIEDNYKLQASNVEFKMPKPSYTIDTLAHLSDLFPSYHFTLLMGSDNLKSLHKWKNYELILRDYKIVVYKRSGSEDHPLFQNPAVSVLDKTPLLNISSTFIRRMIKEGKSIKYIVPAPVEKYIDEMGLYK